ncbi:MAG: redoxin domain-containing protein [Spirochaetes bacterium]|nr:redoxin domain-containing protein [Spirochaetota bacterium]
MRLLKHIPLVLILLVVCACSSTNALEKASLTGQTAYDFSLPDQDGKIWKLSDVLKSYRGAVLAFYPKDDTKL